MKVAILAIGYADGYRRINYDNKSKVYVNGNACDIMGRICMDQTAINIDSVPEVNIGDEVVLFGEGSETSIQDFAKNNLTIPYEIFCSVSGRVPRFYFGNNNS